MNKIVDINQLNKSIEEAKSDDLVKESPKAEDPEDKEISLDDLPRKEDGSIDMDKVSIGIDKGNHYVVPDDILAKYYRELPPLTVNESHTWRVSPYHSKLKILGGDPDNDKAIQTKGGKALQATLKQQRTFAEAIQAMLAQPASKETCQELGLKAGTDNLDAIIAAAARQATRGNVRAMDFVRDTIGQKPSENINAAITGLTEEDKQMLANIQERLSRKD